MLRAYSAIAVLCSVFMIAVSGSPSGNEWNAGKAGSGKRDYGLPELHKIYKATLGPSYSCRPPDQSGNGYENTALFVSKYSKEMNAPELLFNGACGSADLFDVEMAGDDMSLIADLGPTPLDDLALQTVFLTPRLQFERSLKVQMRHTYAVVINNISKRGVFLFTVTGHTPNERLDLEYAVKDFQILNVAAQSPGFDWGQPNLP